MKLNDVQRAALKAFDGGKFSGTPVGREKCALMVNGHLIRPPTAKFLAMEGLVGHCKITPRGAAVCVLEDAGVTVHDYTVDQVRMIRLAASGPIVPMGEDVSAATVLVNGGVFRRCVSFGVPSLELTAGGRVLVKSGKLGA